MCTDHSSYYLDEDEIISADNMLPAVEVEFDTSNANDASDNGDIFHMDIDEDSTAGNNIIHILSTKYNSRRKKKDN